MSSASLSLDISALVSRSLRGEDIDASAAGNELAARYPDLGMSGELIGKAITRAAGMIRAARAGRAAAFPDAPAESLPEAAQPAGA